MDRAVRTIPAGTLALLAALALPRPAQADTIYLKDGKRVDAKITSQTDKAVVVDWYGVPITYWRDQIDRVTSAPAAPAAAANDGVTSELLKLDQLDRLAELVAQGKRFCEAKQYGEAEQVARQAVDLAEREFGSGNRHAVEPLLLLSYVYLSQNRVQEGLASRDRADAIEQALGPAS